MSVLIHKQSITVLNLLYSAAPDNSQWYGSLKPLLIVQLLSLYHIIALVSVSIYKLRKKKEHLVIDFSVPV